MPGEMHEEQITFIGKYKSFDYCVCYGVAGASDQDIAGVLVSLSDHIEKYVYEFSGIDTNSVDKLVQKGNGLSDVITFLKAFKRDTLSEAAKEKKTMMPIAESYLVNRLLKLSNVSFKPDPNANIQPRPEKPEDQIALLANCKGWVSIKKLTINNKTEDWEVAGILAGINYTLVNKAFDFAGFSGEIPKGRKSYGNLVAALEKLDGTNPYLVCKTFEAFGYPPYATPSILISEYPDIKPPKVKGRKPKG